MRSLLVASRWEDAFSESYSFWVFPGVPGRSGNICCRVFTSTGVLSSWIDFAASGYEIFGYRHVHLSTLLDTVK